MPSSVPRAADVGLEQLAEEHEISGASILNVVQHATLRAVSRPERTITAEDLLASVFRELRRNKSAPSATQRYYLGANQAAFPA